MCERERVHGVPADEDHRAGATRVLVATGNDLMERLGEYATTEITRDHLEAIFPEMCVPWIVQVVTFTLGLGLMVWLGLAVLGTSGTPSPGAGTAG